MVKLVRREGKMVMPSRKEEYDKPRAAKLLNLLAGDRIKNIRFSPIRRDGTRGVSFRYKANGEKGSYSYLTDIGRTY